jgi:hypothetical protein
MNALRALALHAYAPVRSPARPQPRTPHPRWSRRHRAHELPGARTAPARLSGIVGRHTSAVNRTHCLTKNVSEIDSLPHK